MPEPEPVYEEQVEAPATPPMSGAGSAREALRQANERRARAANGPPGEQRAGAPARAPGKASPDGKPDFYDEPSADDPDITSAGLVGVPLVVQVLGGTVIDEVVEQS
jgi:DNA polymerase-3 subunit gamma/tau